MELRVLQYFLAVAREQSISAAAESLHLSQPTLSIQLKNLEEELGMRLMIRGTPGSRRITLTEAGLREARLVRQRHDLLKYYLVAILGVDEETAEQDACRMEHVVSQTTLRRMEEYSARTLDGARTGTIKDKE